MSIRVSSHGIEELFGAAAANCYFESRYRKNAIHVAFLR